MYYIDSLRLKYHIPKKSHFLRKRKKKRKRGIITAKKIAQSHRIVESEVAAIKAFVCSVLLGLVIIK